MTIGDRKLIAWCRKVGADLGQLDILVEDIKCRQATEINRKGLEGQVLYLRKHLTREELRKCIWQELQLLQRYGMVRQSKVRAGGNKKRK